MIVFPVVCALLSLLCAVTIARDALRRPRPDKVIWASAFVMFALASGADAIGRATEWSSPLARLYYATGPALVVAFLAVGQLYLLFPRSLRRYGPAMTILVAVLWISMVVNAPIDNSRLAADGWDAIERSGEMIAVTVAINATGTAIIVAGTGWSIWRYWRTRTQRYRMLGCAAILAGTLTVAVGGSLTRLGHYEYLYIAMSAGVALIYLGVLVSRTTDAERTTSRSEEPATEAITGQLAAATDVTDVSLHPGVAYLSEVLAFDDDAIARICSEWSVQRDEAPVLARSDARRAWRLRTHLDPVSARRFDASPVATRRQLTALYFDVILAERAADDITELVRPDAGVRARQA